MVSSFPERGEDVRRVKSVCRGCAVRAQCEDFAMHAYDAFRSGIWGGASSRSDMACVRQRRLASAS